MKKLQRLAGLGRQAVPAILTVALWAAGFAIPVIATPGEAQASVMDALTGGTTKVTMRYRFENVDDGNAATEDANASTLRVRLGYETADFKGVTVYYELQNVAAIDADHYNDLVAGDATYSVVADPEASEVNQAYITYTGISDLTLRVGNQRVKLDNDRHIGNVGWRQNEQTYEGAVAIYSGMENLTVVYARLWNVNTILGGNIDATDSNVLNVNYKTGDHSVTFFFYQIDTQGAITAWQDMGLRYVGKMDMFSLEAEYAIQDEYMDSGRDDANYMLAVLGATMSGITAKLGYEAMEGDGTTGYTTPLGTNHAHNGWADKFLGGNGAAGLITTYLSVAGKASGVKLKAVYLMMEADTGSDLGTEIDLLAVKKVNDNLKVGLKYASFSGDTAAITDVTKMWLFAETSF